MDTLKPNPLLLRFLAAVGLGSTAALVAGGSAVTSISCCPPPEDTGPYTATLNAQCSVRLESSLHTLAARCVGVAGDACPAFADAASLLGEEAVCGPFDVQSVTTSSSSSGVSTSTSSASTSTSSTTGSASSTSSTTSSAAGGAGGGGGSGGAAPAPTLTCCYGVEQSGIAGYGCGRPLLVDGEARVAPVVSRSDWGRDERGPELSPALATELAERWARDAAFEHASVASFARFTLDLLAVGAPAALVRDAMRAGLDEIDHARRCYALAARHAQRPVGPGPLAVSVAPSSGDLVEVATRALLEGCIGETIAAVVAARTLEITTDPGAREALAIIARDEAAHAELAFRFLSWAAREGTVATAIQDRFASVLQSAHPGLAPTSRDRPDVARDTALEAHGQPGDSLRARAAREAITQVIAPCLGAILEKNR